MSSLITIRTVFFVPFRFVPERFPRVSEGWSGPSGPGGFKSGHFRSGDVMVTWGECCSVIGYGPYRRPSLLAKKNIFWFHTRASSVHFHSTESQTFYWSIMTADDSIKCRFRELRHDRPSGRFSKSRGLSASVSFLSSPPPPSSFTGAIFRAGL